MVSSKRLDPIKKLANNQEQKAARSLGESLEIYKLEKDKLKQLDTYRVEYMTAMNEKVSSGISGASLQHYHQFLSKLDFAIKQQKEVLLVCEQRISAKQSHWQKEHGRNQAIGNAIDRLKAKEDVLRQKQETINTDEISTQAFIRRQKINNQN
ncbi:flagellar export protein FliJ [Aliikangiella sp. G2MR2-5]|uniref:flagellar export protein FliJ n=1 Tax=Aliikangiella sp. G2MR2-5 TaxID=2788943 RepID=UPI0018A9765C|nr:flagellar export protein FliJ [Aliikangiella sp. G2MR2-5]